MADTIYAVNSNIRVVCGATRYRAAYAPLILKIFAFVIKGILKNALRVLDIGIIENVTQFGHRPVLHLTDYFFARLRIFFAIPQKLYA
jgi:ABC-type methionine transport system permease subunit